MERQASQFVIEQLQSIDKKENAKAVRYLFNCIQDQVAHFVLKNNGKSEDVDDIFQDGFVALFKLVRDKRLDKVENVEAYLYSICRNLWLKKIKKESRNVALTEAQENIAVPEVSVATLVSQERKEALATLFKALGGSCHRVLIYYYYEKLSMVEIAEQMKFASAAVAKNKKSSCLKKLKNLIMESKHYRELLNHLE